MTMLASNVLFGQGPLTPWQMFAMGIIGFLAGILQGRDAVTSGRMGAVCGALATQTPGDVEGYPDAIQMEAALTGAAITYR